MKSVLFGNPHVDYWKLTLDDVSVREQVIALKGELHAGFFYAATPMCVAPAVLARFADELREVDKTLTGSATLDSKSKQSTVRFTVSVNDVGHVQIVGRYEINGCGLDFTFKTDQTQLGPLVRWLDSLIREYDKAAA